MNTWKPILAALVIFAAGVVTGGVTVKLSSRNPARPLFPAGERNFMGSPRGGMQGPMPGGNPVQTQGSRRDRMGEGQMASLMRRMEQELDLTPEQRTKVDGIMRQSQERVRKIWDQVPTEFGALRDQIRKELTPEQVGRFEKLFRQREEWRPRQPNPGSPEAGPGGSRRSMQDRSGQGRPLQHGPPPGGTADGPRPPL